MKSYIGFNETGKILFCSKGSEPTEQDLGEATGFMEFAGDWQDCYVQEGKVIPMPKAPSENHLFDYKTKTFYQPTQLAVDQMDSDSIAEMWVRVRMKRNTLLAESDWTQMPDSPLNEETKAAWATYRQALRDITLQPNLTDQDWPTLEI